MQNLIFAKHLILMTHSQAAGFSQQFLSTVMSLPTTTMIFLDSPQPVWIFAVLIYYTNKFTNNKKYQMLVSVTQQNTVEPRKIPNEKGTFQSLSILNPRGFCDTYSHKPVAPRSQTEPSGQAVQDKFEAFPFEEALHGVHNLSKERMTITSKRRECWCWSQTGECIGLIGHCKLNKTHFSLTFRSSNFEALITSQRLDSDSDTREQLHGN